MDGTELITISGLLDYVYNRFAVTYLMCFLGVIIGYFLKIASKDLKQLAPANAIGLALQGVLVTVIICALQDFIEIKSFNMYVLYCIFLGIWSPVVVKILTNIKIIKKFIVNFGKKAKDPIISAVGETINQIDNEDKEKLKDKKKKDEEST